MPQKKNADSLELIRGKAGRIFGRVSLEKKILLFTDRNTLQQEFCIKYNIVPAGKIVFSS